MGNTDKHILATLFCLLLLAGCSTTSNLPEGEQLYTGIKEITYADKPKPASRKQAKDSVGVITSIGNAVNTIDRIIAGTDISTSATELTTAPKPLSKEEIKAAKMLEESNLKNFDQARNEVEAVLAYPPNNAIFGSSKYHSPLQVGLRIHNSMADAKGKLGKWIFRNFASSPILISTVSPDMRTKVATSTLQNYGYFQGQVDHEVLTQKNPRKAKISYTVKAGQLYRLDSIAYIDFTGAADSLIRATENERLLKSGDPFNVLNLANEQTRIEKLLRENGYYYFSAPYTLFRADTLQRKHHVQLQVRPADNIPARVNRPWYMGKAFISVRTSDTAPLTSHRKMRTMEFAYSGEKIPLRPSLWFQAITHRHGELYTLTDQHNTIEKLNSLGVFSLTDVNYVPRDSSSTCDTLDIVITAVMDKLYDASFEVNAKMKSNQQVGPGIKFGLAKRNAFRGGEKVAFDIFGSYEWQTGAGAGGKSSLINSYELGTKLSFEFPRFVFPGINRRRLRFPASTVFSLDADWRNRADFFNMITFGGSATYKWHKRKKLQHELTLLSLDFDRMLHTTTRFDSIMNENPALAVSMRDQFIPSIYYQMTYADPVSVTHPLWVQIGVKEAGNLVSGIYAIAGEPWSKPNKELFNNPFAQFAKLTLEAHKTWRLNRRMQLATRFFGGVVYSFGNSEHAPYSEQFYVGGANSVRGFTVRTVGPGSYRSKETKYAYLDQTGDVKFEANAELRAKLFGSLYGAVFLDAGNVWLLRNDPLRPGGQFTMKNIKNIAVGTGAGIRYDLDFLILRFDIGVALHAPYETNKSGWYNIPKFGKSLAYHFAIGYPF